MTRSSHLLGAAFLTACTTLAFAGSVTISTVSGSQFASKDGGILPTGCAVRVGTFNLPDATRDAKLQSTSDYAQLKAWFKPLAEGITGAGTPQQAGFSGTMLRANSFPGAGDVFGTISDIAAAYMTPGTHLYIWVFDNAVPDQCTQWGIYTYSGWQAPQALGSQVLSTGANVQVLQGSTVEGQLRLATPAQTYGNWAWKAFSLSASSSISGASADPDGDGISNLAEYAWQLNAGAADKPLTSVEGSNKKFTFKAPRTLSDVQVSAEYTTDLKTWQPATATVVSSDAVFDTLTTNAPAGQRCFWRVRFTSVTPP